MFEQRRQPLASRRVFLLRLGRSLAAAGGILLPSLGMGVLGYHLLAGLPWVDALLNASMILTGMGPVDQLQTAGAKVFASCYALFSGIVFITTAGVLLAPVVHRFIHKFHLEIQPQRPGSKTSKQGGR